MMCPLFTYLPNRIYELLYTKLTHLLYSEYITKFMKSVARPHNNIIFSLHFLESGGGGKRLFVLLGIISINKISQEQQPKHH